jgi:hypothetical protein
VEDRDYTLEADIVCFLLSESQRPFIFLTWSWKRLLCNTDLSKRKTPKNW